MTRHACVHFVKGSPEWNFFWVTGFALSRIATPGGRLTGKHQCRGRGYAGYNSKKTSAHRHRRTASVSYTHLRAHETDSYLVCRLLLEKKKPRTRLKE